MGPFGEASSALDCVTAQDVQASDDTMREKNTYLCTHSFAFWLMFMIQRILYLGFVTCAYTLLPAHAQGNTNITSSSYAAKTKGVPQVSAKGAKGKTKQELEKGTSSYVKHGLIIVLVVGGLVVVGYGASRSVGSTKDTQGQELDLKKHTFAMIKPDAFDKAEEIEKTIQDHGFTIKESYKYTFNKLQTKFFYAEHEKKEFFNELITYITKGPVWVMFLEKENAVKEFKDLMGDPDPKKAGDGTLRKKYGRDKLHNAIHGSDSVKSAQRELKLFFDIQKDSD